MAEFLPAYPLDADWLKEFDDPADFFRRSPFSKFICETMATATRGPGLLGFHGIARSHRPPPE